jgi:hypothetical protein
MLACLLSLRRLSKMPYISRNTFNANKNYQRVTFQAGEPALDNELNEAQDLALVHTAENGWASAGFLRSTDLRVSAFGGLRFGAAARDHWACEARETADIIVKAGSIFVDGFMIIASEEISLSAEGLDFSVAPVADTYGFIYADFVFSEVDSVEDPEIAQESTGETSRRVKLSVSFGQAESTTSYEAALSGMTDLAADNFDDPQARLWKGNVARIFLCRYFRASGSTSFVQEDLVDLRQSIPGEAANKHTFIKTIRGGDADGVIAWDASTNYLQIGVATGNSDPNGMKNGVILRTPGAPDLYASSSTDQVWAEVGSGNADGTMRTPLGSGLFSFGWLIQDGDALGYIAAGTSNTANSGFPRNKIDFLTTGGTSLYYADPNTLSFTPSALTEQKLNVQPLDTFVGDPSVFVICTRIGDDLVWFDGTVTRGSTTAAPVFEELGGTPSEWSAVVGLDGRNHLGGVSGVEHALNYLCDGNGAGTIGSGRSLRLLVRRGTWLFARGVHKYGTLAEVGAFTDGYDSDSTSLTLEGAGAMETKLQFSNPYTPSRGSLDHSVVEFAANTVIVRGLTFSQTYSGTTFLGSYYSFRGRTIILEDCIFEGPVWVVGDTVRIKNCRFNSLGNTGSSVLFPSSLAPTGFVAQHLLLYPFGAGFGVSSCTWEIEGNTFNTTVSTGTQASVHLRLVGDSGALVRAKITHNIWNYSTNAVDCVPAIDIGGKEGLVEIGHNRFIGASGVGKAGNTAAQTVPFDSLYGGAPIMRYSNDNQMYATGYISIVKGRARESKLHIHNNYFDLSSVGDGHTTIYAMWGGVMAPFNYLTAGSVDTVEYHNISVENNEFLMRNSVGWNDGDGNPQPATWGFWLSPTFQNGQALNNVQIENISVCGNSFDLGGESSANKEFCWRGILAGQITAWPASGGHLTDTSCLIGIQLKNTNAVAGNVHTGRSAKGIEVSNNKIQQRKLTGQTDFVNGLIETVLTLSTASIRWSAGLILVDGGGLPLPVPTASVTAATSDLGYGPMSVHSGIPANSGLLFSPKVSGNSIAAPIYNRSAAGTVSYGNTAIDVIGAFAPSITNNHIYILPEHTVGIALRGSIYGIVSGNIVTAGYGCYSEYTNFVGNNVFNLCPTGQAVAGSPDVQYDASTENFYT